MDTKRLTGPQAGSLKYDLLTALSVAGLHGSPGFQTSMLRLIALVTARYNWRLDELSVGQRDMARMWGVNERTVKREVKRLTDAGVLICKRQGVRGRVGAYRLNFAEIYRSSSEIWNDVGPDFAERMAMHRPSAEARVVQVDFAKPEREPRWEPQEGRGEWRHVMRHLRDRYPDLHQNWFSGLELVGFENRSLRLKAPSKFSARYIETHLIGKLTDAVEQVLGPVDRVEIEF